MKATYKDNVFIVISIKDDVVILQDEVTRLEFIVPIHKVPFLGDGNE